MADPDAPMRFARMKYYTSFHINLLYAFTACGTKVYIYNVYIKALLLSVQFFKQPIQATPSCCSVLPVASYGYPSVHCHTTEIAG